MSKTASALVLYLLAASLVGACTSTSPQPSAVADAAAIPAGDDASDDGGPGGSDDGSVLDAGAAYGQPCTVGDDSTCASGLFCLDGPSGSRVGFCTMTCPKTSSGACSGTPPNTAAFCVVTDVNAKGEKGCAFVCGAASKTFTCPGQLKCQTTDEPPGSGQYLCLP